MAQKVNKCTDNYCVDLSTLNIGHLRKHVRSPLTAIYDLKGPVLRGELGVGGTDSDSANKKQIGNYVDD